MLEIQNYPKKKKKEKISNPSLKSIIHAIKQPRLDRFQLQESEDGTM